MCNIVLLLSQCCDIVYSCTIVLCYDDDCNEMNVCVSCFCVCMSCFRNLWLDSLLDVYVCLLIMFLCPVSVSCFYDIGTENLIIFTEITKCVTFFPPKNVSNMFEQNI